MEKLLIVTWIFLTSLLVAGGDLYPDTSDQYVSVLYPYEELATLYNKNKCMNSLHHRKIDLWDQPSSFEGARIIGEINPGTITNVLDRYDNFYKVANPADGTVGWIKQRQTISLPRVNSHKSCSDHVEASNKYLRQMDYYMDTGDRSNGGLYLAAKRAQIAAIGVIKLCPFSIDLISDYACSLPFYSKVMYDEANKY